MATLREYYDTDNQKVISISGSLIITTSGSNIEVLTKVHLDFDSNTIYVSFFIPEANDSFIILVGLINNLDKALAIGRRVEIQSGLPGEKPVNSKDLTFSGKIFAYSVMEIPENEIQAFQNEVRSQNLYIQYRVPQFAIARSELEKPQAFISHDSRDKDDIARPIAIGLSKLMCPVWFDDYSLRVGDKLRETIEKGILECKKCILVLSPHFLANNGWTKVEFNSIFTRELIEETDLVLPVWHGITKKDLFEYSPSLVNKVGVKSDLGIEEVIRKLHQSIRH